MAVLTPAVGVNINKFDVQLRYNMQRASDLFDLMAGAIQLKGIVF